MPTYNIFGWQKPCYLLQDGYADTFEELMRDDRVANVRHRVGQSEVRQLHGAQRLRSIGRAITRSVRWRGFLATVRATLFSRYKDDDALAMLEQPR